MDATPTDTPGRLERLSLGAAGLHANGLDNAFEVLDAWLTAGGRMIDTAASYGGGESERTIGAWLRARGSRGRVVLLTKVGHPDANYTRNRVTPALLEADLAGSLDRMGVPWVDVLLVHRDDPAMPVGEILDVLAAAVVAGRARAYGVSNWTLSRLDEALAYVAARGLPPLTWSSSYLGLAVPSGPAWPGVVDASDRRSRAWYASHTVRLVAWSPVANGFFADDLDDAAEQFEAYRSPANMARRDRARDLGARHGLTATQVALAWVLCQPMAPIAAIGTTSVRHVAEAIDAAHLRLTDDELRWLEVGDADASAAALLERAWTS